jgi:hypothetical protein
MLDDDDDDDDDGYFCPPPSIYLNVCNMQKNARLVTECRDQNTGHQN